ncbi:MAG: hypothetical protein AAGG56_01195 [Pseudomonadota bacterium]
MDYFDYKAVPAPRRSKKAKGVREPAELFALTLTDAINEQAREGWEYVRAETLAAETPRGFLRRAHQDDVTMLIFRRLRASREPQLASAGHEIVAETSGSASGSMRASPPAAPTRIEPALAAAPKVEPDVKRRDNSSLGRRGPPALREERDMADDRPSPLRPVPRLDPVDPT